MLALGLSLGLFLFFGGVGYSVLSLLYTQRNLLQNALLAPATGFASLIIPIFLLNWFGLPVKQFGLLLGIVLLVAVLFYWIIKRPPIPLRRYLPFFVVLIAASIFTGRPLLEFGFNWLSYANDDMANYCLGALRFLNYAYSATPNIGDALQGKDYTQNFWFMFAPGMMRPGSELLLAWVSAVTGLMPDQIFMPVILALYLALISAAGSLICYSRRWRNPALVLCILLSISPLTALGVFYQLIAQIGGLALLCAGLTILLRSLTIFHGAALTRYSLLASIQIVAIAIVYPEVAPFFGLAYVLYFLISHIRRHMWPNRSFFIFLGCILVFSLLLLNRYGLHLIVTILAQIDNGNLVTDLSLALFPYFLVPSGLSDLWGLHAIATNTAGIWNTLAIFLGFLLLILTGVTAIWLAFKEHAVAIMAVIMLAVGLYFFRNNNDFALFKMAMYVQPFFLGTLVVAACQWINIAFYRYTPLLLLGILGFPAHEIYLKRSRGLEFPAIPFASQKGINQQLRQFFRTLPAQKMVVSDAHTIVLAKFQSLAADNHRPVQFLSRDSFKSLYRLPELKWQTLASHVDLRYSEETIRFKRAIQENNVERAFDLHNPGSAITKQIFMQPIHMSFDKEPVLLANMPQQTLLNRRKFMQYADQNIKGIPWSEVHNHLVFTGSKISQEYYLPDSDVSAAYISLYQLEPDYFYPNRTLASIGRYFLFQILKPDPTVRVLLDMTTSLGPERGTPLPPAVAIGTERRAFPLVGRGGARVFSAPISPQMLGSSAYIGMDMGKTGRQFDEPERTGSMNLYGKIVPMDARRVVGFARDISIISEDEYRALQPPASLSRFPADLVAPDLEYSGIYEDGWLSEQAFFYLTQPTQQGYFVIQGMIPQLKDPHFKTTLRVFIDGREAINKTLTTGDFDIHIPHQGSGKHKVTLQFSHWQELTAPDSRPTGALLKFIGFKENTPTSKISRFPEDLTPSIESSGIYKDGWLSEKSYLYLTQREKKGNLVVKGVIPQIGDPNFQTEIQVFIDDRKVMSKKLPIGDFELQIPNQEAGKHKVALEFSKSQLLPAPDSRTTAALLKFLGFKDNTPPTNISKFPADLASPELKYSGIYKDGWLEQKSSLYLTQPNLNGKLIVKGMIPQILDPKFQTELQIFIDNQEVAKKVLAFGEFEIQIPSQKAGKHQVILRFSNLQTLPAPDNRKIGALLNFMGFK